MRLNKFLALATGMSRRAADQAISQNRVMVNDALPSAGQQVTGQDRVTLDGTQVEPPVETVAIILNKPPGYVCSRDGQGSRTVYELLPPELHALKTVGRLDKDSSGLLLLTNDGQLAHQLTHPSFQKTKSYTVELKEPLQPLHRQMISDYGVILEDGPSKLQLERAGGNDFVWQVAMREGRNRQIRRTFESLGYAVKRLHRTKFGHYSLEADLAEGRFKIVG
jgi:23S rRNA pseudouridine2605 synthase